MISLYKGHRESGRKFLSLTFYLTKIFLYKNLPKKWNVRLDSAQAAMQQNTISLLHFFLLNFLQSFPIMIIHNFEITSKKWHFKQEISDFTFTKAMCGSSKQTISRSRIFPTISVIVCEGAVRSFIGRISSLIWSIIIFMQKQVVIFDTYLWEMVIFIQQFIC